MVTDELSSGTATTPVDRDRQAHPPLSYWFTSQCLFTLVHLKPRSILGRIKFLDTIDLMLVGQAAATPSMTTLVLTRRKLD